MAGGSGAGDEATASVEIWDPELGAFRADTALAQPRAEHTASALPDGRVLLIGGMGPMIGSGDDAGFNVLAGAELLPGDAAAPSAS